MVVTIYGKEGKLKFLVVIKSKSIWEYGNIVVQRELDIHSKTEKLFHFLSQSSNKGEKEFEVMNVGGYR